MRKPFDKSISVDEMILGEPCSEGCAFSGKMGGGVGEGCWLCARQISGSSWRRASPELWRGWVGGVGEVEVFSGFGRATSNTEMITTLDPIRIEVHRVIWALVVLIL